MNDRITRTDLEAARAAHEGALRRYGMIAGDESIGLTIGSKTYGNAYRIHLNMPGSTGHYAPPVGTGSGYLGMTARDAYDMLTATTRAIHDVAYAIDRHPRAVALDEV